MKIHIRNWESFSFPIILSNEDRKEFIKTFDKEVDTHIKFDGEELTFSTNSLLESKYNLVHANIDNVDYIFRITKYHYRGQGVFIYTCRLDLISTYYNLLSGKDKYVNRIYQEPEHSEHSAASLENINEEQQYVVEVVDYKSSDKDVPVFYVYELGNNTDQVITLGAIYNGNHRYKISEDKLILIIGVLSKWNETTKQYEIIPTGFKDGSTITPEEFEQYISQKNEYVIFNKKILPVNDIINYTIENNTIRFKTDLNYNYSEVSGSDKKYVGYKLTPLLNAQLITDNFAVNGYKTVYKNSAYKVNLEDFLKRTLPKWMYNTKVCKFEIGYDNSKPVLLDFSLSTNETSLGYNLKYLTGTQNSNIIINSNDTKHNYIWDKLSIENTPIFMTGNDSNKLFQYNTMSQKRSTGNHLIFGTLLSLFEGITALTMIATPGLQGLGIGMGIGALGTAIGVESSSINLVNIAKDSQMLPKVSTNTIDKGSYLPLLDTYSVKTMKGVLKCVSENTLRLLEEQYKYTGYLVNKVIAINESNYNDFINNGYLPLKLYRPEITEEQNCFMEHFEKITNSLREGIILKEWKK